MVGFGVEDDIVALANRRLFNRLGAWREEFDILGEVTEDRYRRSTHGALR